MNQEKIIEMFDFLHDAIVDSNDDLEWCKSFTEDFERIRTEILES